MIKLKIYHRLIQIISKHCIITRNIYKEDSLNINKEIELWLDNNTSDQLYSVIKTQYKKLSQKNKKNFENIRATLVNSHRNIDSLEHNNNETLNKSLSIFLLKDEIEYQNRLAENRKDDVIEINQKAKQIKDIAFDISDAVDSRDGKINEIQKNQEVIEVNAENTNKMANSIQTLTKSDSKYKFLKYIILTIILLGLMITLTVLYYKSK